jgi:O-methyltransferase involved in polyketide biosynthesis
MDQVDYDIDASPIRKQRRRQTTSIAVRGAQLDIWTRQFLNNHDRPVVLQIGAGLDSRAFRVDPGPDVDWYDIDFPDVIALRERFYPKREHYHLVASSATDLSWLDSIPADRPALFIAEGVSMYLTENDGVGLLRRVVERFPAGELQLDFWSRFGSKAMRKSNAVVRWSNSEVSWSVDDPDDILSAVPGTRLIRAIPIFEADTTQRLSKGYRRFAAAAARTPVLRKIVQLHRYAF